MCITPGIAKVAQQSMEEHSGRGPKQQTSKMVVKQLRAQALGCPIHRATSRRVDQQSQGSPSRRVPSEQVNIANPCSTRIRSAEFAHQAKTLWSVYDPYHVSLPQSFGRVANSARRTPQRPDPARPVLSNAANAQIVSQETGGSCWGGQKETVVSQDDEEAVADGTKKKAGERGDDEEAGRAHTAQAHRGLVRPAGTGGQPRRPAGTGGQRICGITADPAAATSLGPRPQAVHPALQHENPAQW